MMSERMYRALLVAYPSEHRRVYGEPMVQSFRDRMRRDGGGLRTLSVWVQIIFDLVSSALKERMEGIVATDAEELWAMLKTMFRTLLEPRRVGLLLVVLLVPLALALLAIASIAREANYAYESGVLRAERGVEKKLAAGEMTQEEAKHYRDGLEESRFRRIRMQSILKAPNSIQFLAQTMVTGGGLFALFLGIITGRAAISSGLVVGADGQPSHRWWALAPYYVVPIFLWSLVTAATVGLGLLAGSITPSFLSLEGPIVENSVRNLAIATSGVWLAGFMWSAIGVSLAVIVRSARIALIVGVVILVGEIGIGSLIDNIQDPLPFTIPILLPTHGAIELVSIDAPKLYHGLLTPEGGHPLHAPHAVVGAILLVGVGLAAVGLGLRWYSKGTLRQSSSSLPAAR